MSGGIEKKIDFLVEERIKKEASKLYLGNDQI